MMKDIAYVADLGVDVGDVVPDPDALLFAAEEAGIADVNDKVELAALAGPDAVEAIVEGGSIDAAVEVALEAVAVIGHLSSLIKLGRPVYRTLYKSELPLPLSPNP